MIAATGPSYSRTAAGDAQSLAARAFSVALVMVLVFGAIGTQLVRLALKGQIEPQISMSRPLTEFNWRPDIVDRRGRLLATDVEAPTVYADPSLITDVDEVIERLFEVFPDLNVEEMRRLLSDRNRRFVRIRRGLAPATAQRVHNFGLPGIAFRPEPKRVYPNGSLAGHVLGHVNVDNQGTSGIERFIDQRGSVAADDERAPVQLSIDMAVQHALGSELREAVNRTKAAGASGIVLDVNTGEILAAVSLPDIDPAQRTQSLDAARNDKNADGVYELGSIFKAVTVAMALEKGTASLDKIYDVRKPLRVGAYTIRDPYPVGRPLSVRDIFIHSSNVGAGMIALENGADAQRAFLKRLGLMEPMRTEAGPIAPPLLPSNWGKIETITISYGHGMAVAPLQFAVAAATLINGGWQVQPTLQMVGGGNVVRTERLISEETSAAMRDLMRRNVTSPQGTGRRAEVPGYEVGGKTGTAELPGKGGYREKDVISSFFAAFPMSAPRYVVLVSLFEPKQTDANDDRIGGGAVAAPAAGRAIARIAPLLDILPQN